MNEIQILFTILGIVLILSGLLSLIYQFFSASTLTFLGVISLNYTWHWFNWNWLILFIILWLVGILSGFWITNSESKKTMNNNYWMSAVGGLLGSIMIPLPFIGTLIGVFLGTLLAHLIEDPLLNREKFQLALKITFKSFLGLIIEISAVLIMVLSLILLAIF